MTKTLRGRRGIDQRPSNGVRMHSSATGPEWVDHDTGTYQASSEQWVSELTTLGDPFALNKNEKTSSPLQSYAHDPLSLNPYHSCHLDNGKPAPTAPN